MSEPVVKALLAIGGLLVLVLALFAIGYSVDRTLPKDEDEE